MGVFTVRNRCGRLVNPARFRRGMAMGTCSLPPRDRTHDFRHLNLQTGCSIPTGKPPIASASYPHFLPHSSFSDSLRDGALLLVVMSKSSGSASVNASHGYIPNWSVEEVVEGSHPTYPCGIGSTV